jgi:hypothetical protein
MQLNHRRASISQGRNDSACQRSYSFYQIRPAERILHWRTERCQQRIQPPYVMSFHRHDLFFQLLHASAIPLPSNQSSKSFLNIPADNWGHFESEEPTDLPFPSNEGVSSLMTEECDRLESLLVNKSNGQSRSATTNTSLIMPSVTNFVNQLDDMLGITLEVSLSTSKQPAAPMRPINPTTRARTKGFFSAFAKAKSRILYLVLYPSVGANHPKRVCSYGGQRRPPDRIGVSPMSQ